MVRADLECKAFRSQLLRMAMGWARENYPDQLYFPFPGFSLKVQGQPHDFGEYFEVLCFFDPECKPAVDLAYYLEANLPKEWDERSKVTLGLTT